MKNVYDGVVVLDDKALAINPKNVAAITGKEQALAALNQPK